MKDKKFSVWLGGIASCGISTLTLFVYQPNTLAMSFGSCLIPDGSSYTDKPYNSLDIEQSFLNSDCTPITLTQDITFFRYYSFPPPPAARNVGRFFTTNDFSLNSEAIVNLALYPFPPNPQFQNFAYYRETVTVLAGTTVYEGTAGPQPYDNPNSCYTGGARQYFFAGDNVSSNPNITFTYEKNLTRDTRYPNTYGVGDPCQVVPEPSPVAGIGAMAALGLAIGFNRTLTQSKTKGS